MAIANIYVTIDENDADTILNQYSKQTTETEIFFKSSEEVKEKEEEIQFSLIVTKEMAEWCKSLCKDDLDESGVLHHILTSYQEKTGITV